MRQFLYRLQKNLSEYFGSVKSVKHFVVIGVVIIIIVSLLRSQLVKDFISENIVFGGKEDGEEFLPIGVAENVPWSSDIPTDYNVKEKLSYEDIYLDVRFSAIYKKYFVYIKGNGDANYATEDVRAWAIKEILKFSDISQKDINEGRVEIIDLREAYNNPAEPPEGHDHEHQGTDTVL